jgi:hypothetical protein
MPRGPRKKVAASAGAAEPAKGSKINGNGANLGFEAQLFLAADKLRKNLEPSDYAYGRRHLRRNRSRCLPTSRSSTCCRNTEV